MKRSLIIDEIDRSHREQPILKDHCRCPMPSNREVKKIVADAKRLLLPGFYGDRVAETGNRIHTARLVGRLQRRLSRQIARVLLYLESTRGRRDALIQGKRLADVFLTRLPAVRRLLAADLEAHLDGDPAAFNRDQIVIAYPGFYAILVYRLAHELTLLDVPFLPRMFTEFAHRETGIDIHPGARIGPSFMIDHGTGVVIGETAVIGAHVRIYQGVTLGAITTKGGQSLKGVKRHPTIEDGVTIYAGASILGGGTVVGTAATIGSNAFITESVAPGTRISIKLPDLTVRPPKAGEPHDHS